MMALLPWISPDRSRTRRHRWVGSTTLVLALLGGLRCASDDDETEPGARDCEASLTRCGGACVDLESDADHCGACNSDCASDEVCSLGACADECATGATACGASCVDLQTNAAHCGDCDHSCADDERCMAGACTPEAGAGGAGGSGGAGGATFSVSSSLSATIGTVGIVEWSVDVPVTSAHIDFGRDPAAFEYHAPVPEPDADGNRTLLLGMKPSTTYSYRIVVESEGVTYRSPRYEITTDPVRNGLPSLEVTTELPEKVDGGFTLGCVFGQGSLEGSWITIIDGDGDYVWWYRDQELRNCSRARLSYDGAYMWAGNANVRGGNGMLVRIPMDGSPHEQFSVSTRHHDFLVMPDERVVTIEFADENRRGCDVVAAFDPVTETSSPILDVREVDPASEGECHSNAINWWPEEELFTLSVLNWNSIVAFSSAGEVAWVAGGTVSDFSGVSWSRQHQHHLLGDTLLMFNNEGIDGSSNVLTYQLGTGDAELVSTYSSGYSSLTFGDVKRLGNDNLLITYSNNGVIQEVSPKDELVREINTDSIGYTVRRASLYGPPPPFAE